MTKVEIQINATKAPNHKVSQKVKRVMFRLIIPPGQFQQKDCARLIMSGG